ncbi:MAG: hypothetical protein ACTS80_01120 [Candidatus Hodgkinia cicadicola]
MAETALRGLRNSITIVWDMLMEMLLSPNNDERSGGNRKLSCAS